uniref:Phorbol-ester/DAG-type domain-containing protein n=1 Tax=Steinernema glaseri TaxID=37863 RepID=A0A1I7Y0L7_9BILA
MKAKTRVDDGEIRSAPKVKNRSIERPFTRLLQSRMSHAKPFSKLVHVCKECLRLSRCKRPSNPLIPICLELAFT